MEWFTEQGELSGTTHEQRLRASTYEISVATSRADSPLVGNRNIGTTDPKILQAVLKDQFEGTLHFPRFLISSTHV